MNARHKERFEGPTKEHLSQDGVMVETGDDKQGTITWRLLSRLEQTYNTWRVKAGSREEQELIAECAALKEVGRAYQEGGMLGSVGSVDLGNASFQGGAGRSHLAKTERQLNDRNKVYKVKQRLTQEQWIVVSNVVFNDNSLIAAGYAIGEKSQTSAYRAAGRRLKRSGEVVARLLGY